MYDPPAISLLLLVASAAGSLLALALCPSVRQLFRQRWQVLTAFVLLNLVLKIPFAGPFFHGMEYEDCYVHQAVARQLSDPTNIPRGQDVFRESIYSVGSLDSGTLHQTFLHFIGYPTAIRLLQAIVGDTPAAGHWISIISSCLNVLLVALLASCIADDPRLPLLALVVYTCLPILNAYAATTSAEVYSSLYVMALLCLLHVQARYRGFSLQRVGTDLAFGLILAFAILVKRENVIGIPLYPLLYYSLRVDAPWLDRVRIWDTLKRSAVSLAIPVTFALLLLDLRSAWADEQLEIQALPFSIKTFSVLAPLFAGSLLHPRLYLAIGFWLLLTPAVWFRYKAARPAILLTTAYIGMYAAHWRSYYFLQSYQATAWDSIRYMLNLLPVISVLAAASLLAALAFLESRIKLRPKATRMLFGSAAVGLFLVSIFTSGALRSELTAEEQERRIGPIVRAIDTVQQDGGRDAWLLTFQPCVVQAYAPRWFRNADLRLADRFGSEGVAPLLRTGDLYVLLAAWDRDPVSVGRFKTQLDWLGSQEASLVYESQGWQLLRLNQQAR